MESYFTTDYNIVVKGEETTAPDANTISHFEDVPAIGGSECIGSCVISWSLINCILLAFIVGGNCLTIIAVRTCRRLRGIISNLFICSLAVSDLIVGITLPFHLAFYLDLGIEKSHALCLLRFFLIIFGCCVSLLTLITIAIDRYIAVLYALHYRRFMTRRVALYLIAFNWIFGALIASIPLYWNHWKSASHCEYYQVLPSWYMVGVITPGFIVTWTVMLMLYYRIMKEASKQVQQMKNSNCIVTSQKNVSSDWKSIQIVVIIMGCFSICWLPYFIVACAQIFGIYSTKTILYKIVFSLAMCNSGLNPIIYAWKNSNFRKAFALLIRCKSPNGHCMYTENGSLGSHHLPRQNSNMVMMIPSVDAGNILCSSDLTANNLDTNNNTQQIINDLHPSKPKICLKINEIAEGAEESGPEENQQGNYLGQTNRKMDTTLNGSNAAIVFKSDMIYCLDEEVKGERPTPLGAENPDTISRESLESVAHNCDEECASCGLYQTILRKSIRFKSNFAMPNNKGNKMIE